jgi:anti-sigma-K factor RskA
MSDFSPLPPEDDALAAEYVLGLLDAAERTTAERRRRSDPAFAAAVVAWENRLSPLNAGFDEVPVRNLLPAIEARLFATPERPRRRWFAPFAGALTAAALAVAVIAVLPPPLPEAAPLTASLAAEGQALAFTARIDPADGTLTLIRTAGAPAEAGQDLQLWVIGADGVPASLGLIREAESTRPAEGLAPGQVLAVSLEPAGGSPTGQPTGPVLVTGVIAEG